MNISLTPELEEMINQKVASGMYGSASEVVREALRLLKEQHELRERRLEELRREIAVGLEQLDRGESVPFEEAFEQLREMSRRRRSGLE